MNTHACSLRRRLAAQTRPSQLLFLFSFLLLVGQATRARCARRRVRHQPSHVNHVEGAHLRVCAATRASERAHRAKRSKALPHDTTRRPRTSTRKSTSTCLTLRSLTCSVAPSFVAIRAKADAVSRLSTGAAHVSGSDALWPTNQRAPSRERERERTREAREGCRLT